MYYGCLRQQHLYTRVDGFLLVSTLHVHTPNLYSNPLLHHPIILPALVFDSKPKQATYLELVL